MERKLKETELKKAYMAKNEFLANISHEIRTPLNSIIGFSEILSNMINKTQEENYLNAIKKAGNNLLSLINEILDLSKMEAGKLTIKKRFVNIHMLLNDISQLFRTRFQDKDLEFVIEVDDPFPDNLFIDDTRLRQVLTNLIDNAIKFTDKGYIKLRLHQEKTSTATDNLEVTPNLNVTGKVNVAILIEDTGIGIAEDKLNIIFNSFQQASSKISRTYGGTGVGLSICKHLIELMGGWIQVESTEDRGSVFKVFLPEIQFGPSTGDGVEKSFNYIQKNAHSILDNKTPDKILSFELLEKYCMNNNKLKKKIDAEIFQLIPEFQEGLKLGSIHIMTQNMVNIGHSSHIPELTAFGLKLSQYSQSFDIEKLNGSLQHLYRILKKIV